VLHWRYCLDVEAAYLKLAEPTFQIRVRASASHMTSRVDSSHLTKAVHDSLHVAEQPIDRNPADAPAMIRHGDHDLGSLHAVNHRLLQPGRTAHDVSRALPRPTPTMPWRPLLYTFLLHRINGGLRLPPQLHQTLVSSLAAEGGTCRCDLLNLPVRDEILRTGRRDARLSISIWIEEHVCKLTHSSFASLFSSPSESLSSPGKCFGNHPHVPKSTHDSSPALPSCTSIPSSLSLSTCLAAPRPPSPLGLIPPFAFTTLCHGTFSSWKKCLCGSFGSKLGRCFRQTPTCRARFG
jgi:hypothetical protein